MGVAEDTGENWKERDFQRLNKITNFKRMENVIIRGITYSAKTL